MLRIHKICTPMLCFFNGHANMQFSMLTPHWLESHNLSHWSQMSGPYGVPLRFESHCKMVISVTRSPQRDGDVQSLMFMMHVPCLICCIFARKDWTCLYITPGHAGGLMCISESWWQRQREFTALKIYRTDIVFWREMQPVNNLDPLSCHRVVLV